MRIGIARLPKATAHLSLGLLLAGAAPMLRAQVNQPPDVHLPSPAPDTAPSTPVTFAVSVSDPDVGAGLMEMEIDISDPDGAGPLTPASAGTFSWGFGTHVLSDVAVVDLAAMNAALLEVTFTPAAQFAGQARIVFEIDDQGNTGSGGTLSRTRFLAIDVCAPSELGSPACATNAAPDIALPPTGTTPRGTPIGVPTVVSDVDVGAGLMQMEIDISDPDGLGPLTSVDVGSFSWSQGIGVQSDVAELPIGPLNAALAGVVFTPNPAFIGQARLVMEIDDRGNAGSGGVLSRTRFALINVVPDSGQVRFAGGCLVTHGEGVILDIAVERIGGSEGAASVQVNAIDVSAQQGADFTLAGTTLNWSDGQSGVRNAQIEILDDALAEGEEHFVLALETPVGASLAVPSTRLARLRDVDGAGLLHLDGFEGECPP